MKRILFILACLLQQNAGAQQNGFITVGQGKLYYEQRGKGPAMLFLHGGFLDHSMWEKQAAFFSKQYRVVTIDLPGHGETFVHDSVMLIADLIRICMDSLHIAHASIIGLSLGASCAVDFALAYPGRVDKLVLASPGLSGGPDVIKMDSTSLKAFALADSAEQSGDNKKFAAVFCANWCIGPFRKASDVDTAIRSYVYAQVLFTAMHHRDDPWPLFRKNPRAAKKVGAIKNRLLLILGDRDIPYIDSVCHYFYKNVAGAKLAIVHAAHMVNLEQPGLFNSLVEAFLRE